MRNEMWERTYSFHRTPPQTMIVSLKRNDVDPITGKDIKNNQPINITSTKFDLDFSNNKKYKYEINGTICHSGNTSDGHYVAYLKMKNESFLLLNDEAMESNKKLIDASTCVYAVFATLQ